MFDGVLADRSLYEGKPCVTMGQLLKEASEESSDQTDFPVNSEKLAIILYTSGSTGVPKGEKHLKITKKWN